MAPVLAFLAIAQAAPTVEQIHAEDTKVIEATLLALRQPDGRRSSKPLYVMNNTSTLGYFSNSVWGGPHKKPLKVPQQLCDNILARNRRPISLAWLRFGSVPFRTMSENELKNHSFWSKPGRQTVYLNLPGYSKDHRRAVIQLTHAWSEFGVGRVTMLLKNEGGRWRTTKSILEEFVK